MRRSPRGEGTPAPVPLRPRGAPGPGCGRRGRVLLCQIYLGAKAQPNSHPPARREEGVFSGRAFSAQGAAKPARGQLSVPPSPLIPPLSPGTSSGAARSLQGLPSLPALAAERRRLCVCRFRSARRGRAQGGRAVLNLPGTGIGPGRRERSSRRGRESIHPSIPAVPGAMSETAGSCSPVPGKRFCSLGFDN